MYMPQEQAKATFWVLFSEGFKPAMIVLRLLPVTAGESFGVMLAIHVSQTVQVT